MNWNPGMRALDLGCGKAISSIFLAKGFDVKAWATDFWNCSTDNWKRISEIGVIVPGFYREYTNVIAGDNITFIRIIAKRKEG